MSESVAIVAVCFAAWYLMAALVIRYRVLFDINPGGPLTFLWLASPIVFPVTILEALLKRFLREGE